jgi:membrane protein YqaA with SNARE-associated domain
MSGMVSLITWPFKALWRLIGLVMGNPTGSQTIPDGEHPVIRRRTSSDWVRALAPLSLAILFSVSIIVLITKFSTHVEDLKGYGYLGAFAIGFLGNATVILPAPSLAFTAALGGVLNPVLVGLAAGAGEAIGELTGYLAGISGKQIIENRTRYEQVCNYMDRYGGWVFFVLAAIPNPLFDIAGIAAGVVRFPIWKFLLSAWTGKTLKAVLLASAASQLLTSSQATVPF